MLKKYFRTTVLGTVIAYCSLIGLFLIYTTVFALLNSEQMILLGDPWTVTRLLGGTGFLAMAAAFAILWDISNELQLLV